MTGPRIQLRIRKRIVMVGFAAVVVLRLFVMVRCRVTAVGAVRAVIMLAIGPLLPIFYFSALPAFNPKWLTSFMEVIRLHGGLFQFCWIVGSTLKRLATAEVRHRSDVPGAHMYLSNNSRVRFSIFYLLEFYQAARCCCRLPPVVRCNFLRAGAEADRAAR